MLTGADGQLGAALQKAALPAGFTLLCANRARLDIGCPEAVAQFFSAQKIDFCINAAAYTAVDIAETESAQAFLVNAQGVEHLAKNCQKHGTHLLHISTDFVFDGRQSTPYHPADATNPLNVYGKSKRAGEERLLEFCPQATIVRTSWLYSRERKNFLTTMLRLAKTHTKLQIVSDQISAPTYAADLAQLIFEIVGHPETPGGIFHFSNNGVASWYDFAHAIFEESGIKITLNPIRSAEYPTPAVRPSFSLLDMGSTKKAFPHFPFRHWRTALRACMREESSIETSN